jgi:hypothetical protein
LRCLQCPALWTLASCTAVNVLGDIDEVASFFLEKVRRWPGKNATHTSIASTLGHFCLPIFSSITMMPLALQENQARPRGLVLQEEGEGAATEEVSW